ncbi:MAG: hypothetical protein M1812_007696 [Candelaria pacifica]|nr:MAG: hypothetical protein M1812_007696 [Candelaria pacifica]
MSNREGLDKTGSEGSHPATSQINHCDDERSLHIQTANPSPTQEDRGITEGTPNLQIPMAIPAQVGQGVVEGPPDLPFEQGPCKIVTANYEGKDVLALTLSLSMIVGIKNLLKNNDKVSKFEEGCKRIKGNVEAKKLSLAVHAHEIAKLKVEAEDLDLHQEGLRELDAMNSELSHSMIISLLEYEQAKQQLPSPQPEDPPRQLERKFGLLHTCKDELTALLLHEENMGTLLASLKAQQKGSQDRLHEHLEQLLKEAELLDKERSKNDPPITLPPLAETLAALAQDRSKDNAPITLPPLAETQAPLAHVPSPAPSTPSDVPSLEQLYRCATFQELRDNWQRYKRASFEFQKHQENYSERLQGFRREKDLNQQDCTSGDFAQIYVQDGRRATRALIDAEAQFKDAEARARILKVLRNSPEQEFDFVDRSDDGYREGSNAFTAATVNRPWVESWLQKTTDCENLDPYVKGSQDRECDKWNRNPVEIWDSISQVADGRWRLEIDRLRSKERPRYNLRRRRATVDSGEYETSRKRQRRA